MNASCSDTVIFGPVFNLFACKLYSITYPSLHDNNILRRILVSELQYWSEELKRRWMQGSGEWDEASALFETKGGEDEDCLPEQKTDMEEMEIGKQLD